MWNSAAQTAVMMRTDYPRIAAPSSALCAALNSYQYGSYLVLKRRTPQTKKGK
jgi:hypothetical protein